MKREEKELENLLKECKKASTKRIQCVYFKLKYGWNSKQISEAVGFCPSYVREMQSKYKKEGKKAFFLESTGGRNRENMSIEEEAELINNFKEEAGKGNIVEISKIKEAYDEKLGKRAAESTVYRMLNRHGWRKIAPRPNHPKNDKNAMENFKKTSHG